VQKNNTGTFTLAFPAGTAVGDFAVVVGSFQDACFGGGNGVIGFSTAGTSPWTTVYGDGPSANISSCAASRTLISADITAGAVQCQTNSGEFGAVSMTVFIGSHSVQNNYHAKNGGSFSSPVALTGITATAPAYVLYWGATRLSSSAATISVDHGAVLSTLNTSGGGAINAVSYGQLVTTTLSSYTANYSFNVTANGYGVNAIVVQ
jgi:hypothetical protein